VGGTPSRVGPGRKGEGGMIVSDLLIQLLPFRGEMRGENYQESSFRRPDVKEGGGGNNRQFVGLIIPYSSETRQDPQITSKRSS